MRFRLLPILILLITSCLPKQSNEGKVIKIKDGDSIVLLDSLQQEIEIRLAYIDAPERHQDYGTKAKQHLSSLIYGETITYSIVEPKDRYGRIIGELYIQDTIVVNKAMLEAGMAWHYDQYPGGFYYEQLERKARKQKIGLWKQDAPVPPWEFRRN